MTIYIYYLVSVQNDFHCRAETFDTDHF